MHYTTGLLKLVTLVVAVFLLSSISAQANVITYSNLSSFLANTTATTTLDFEAQNTNGPESGQFWGDGLGIGHVGFYAYGGYGASMAVLGPQYFETYGLTSNYLTEFVSPYYPIPGSEISVYFESPVTAVGMDLGILNTWNTPGLDVFITLYTDNIDFFKITAPLLWETDNAMSFIGFTADGPFGGVSIMAPFGSVALDNFIYGTQPQFLVPEPASLLLLGTGLAGIGLAAWRKRK